MRCGHCHGEGVCFTGKVRPQQGTYDISKLKDNFYYRGGPGYVAEVTFDMAYTSLQTLRKRWIAPGLDDLLKRSVGSCALCRDKGEEVNLHHIMLYKCVHCEGTGKQVVEDPKMEQKVVYHDSQHTGDNIFHAGSESSSEKRI